MVTGTGEEPHRGPGVTAPAQPVPAQPVPCATRPTPTQAVPTEAVPDAVPPAEGRAGTERVRRPADLLLAVFAFVVVAVVLGSIRALPLGSTEVADDVSGWLLHIPRWLSYAAAVVAGVACSSSRSWRWSCWCAVSGGTRGTRSPPGWPAPRRPSSRRSSGGSSTRPWSARCCTAAIRRSFVVDTAFVAFVVGTDLSRLSHWSRWWPRASAALLLSGLAVGTLTPFAVVIVASGGLLVGWVVRWLLGAASVLPGIAELTGWLTSQRRHGHGPVGRRPKPRPAGGEAGRRHPDPRSPVRPRHPRIGPGPSAVGAGPPPAGGRGARRARFPRPGRAARPGLLPGAAGRRAQSRGPAARRDARRDAGARHDHPGQRAGSRGGAASGRDVIVRVAAPPARRRRRAP